MERIHSLDELSPFVREVGLQRHDSWRKPRRIYDHQFLYCFQGEVRVSIEDRQYCLSAGNVAIIPPDTPHTLWKEREDSELYWFHCDLFFREDRDWLYPLYNTPERYALLFSGPLCDREHIRAHPTFTGGFRLPEVVRFIGAGEVDFLFRELHQRYTRQDPDFGLQAKSLVIRLFLEILRHCGHYDQAATPDRQVSDTVKIFVQNNYFRKLSVRDICACTRYNPDYAGKLFKRETGLTLIEYLNRVRVESAKKLLIDQDLSLSDIAEMVGFANENYLCSVTRRIEGTTPARIRRHLAALMEGGAAPGIGTGKSGLISG